MVGGLLVALAAVLAWWAALGGSDGSDDRFVVAARSIGAGERITAEHLALSPADLGPELRKSAFTSPAPLVDMVAAGPISPGELIQAGSVTEAADTAPERELSFPVSSTWAAGGRLQSGDRIDVYATYGEGTSSQTRRILTDVRVRRIDSVSSDRLGDSGQQVITVGLDHTSRVALVVNAVQSAEITVARVSGELAEAPAGEGHDRYDADVLDADAPTTSTTAGPSS